MVSHVYSAKNRRLPDVTPLRRQLIATPTTSSAASLFGEFERIFREHYEFVYRTARHVTGTPHDAEDVVQTLFVRLLGKELPPEVRSNPRGYLYRSAVNIALDVVRSRKRHGIADDAGMLDRVTSERTSVAEEDAFATLREALAELRPKAAEIVILHHLHGYSHSEIAALLGTTQGTIAVSLFRTRARLRKSIRRYLENKK